MRKMRHGRDDRDGRRPYRPPYRPAGNPRQYWHRDGRDGTPLTLSMPGGEARRAAVGSVSWGLCLSGGVVSRDVARGSL